MTSFSQAYPHMLLRQPPIDLLLQQQGQQVKIQFQRQEHECYLSSANKYYLDFLKKTIKSFLQKYLETPTDLQIDFALVKLEKIRENTFRQKGTRQLAAAVVYCQYPDQIRLSIKQFCLRNQLNPKAFNRKYKAYYKLFKQAQKDAIFNNTVKIQEKMQQKEKQEDNDPQPLPYEPDFLHVNSPKQAFELVFDSIFKSQYFQANRRETIDKMAKRFMEIDRRILDSIDWTNNYTIRLYYAIFGFLKQLDMPISFMKYRDAVSERTGYSLQQRYISKTLSLFKQITNQNTLQQRLQSSESNLSI